MSSGSIVKIARRVVGTIVGLWFLVVTVFIISLALYALTRFIGKAAL